MSDLSDKLEYIIASRGDAIMAKKKELSFSRFLKRFSTEKACADYLYQISGPRDSSAPSVAAGSITLCRAIAAINANAAVTRLL